MNLCIYCGIYEGKEKYHIPPKCFFTEPLPSNLITVPSCSICNRKLGKIDENIRNLISSLETTEIHPAVVKQLAEKRNRSISREGGIHSFNFLLDNIALIDRYTNSGKYIGKHFAFNLMNDELKKILERIARALLFHRNGIGYGKYKIDYRISPKEVDFKNLPDNLQKFLLSGCYKNIGNGIFSYVGYTWPEKINSFWILNFYRGIEFLVIIRE